MRRFIVAVAVAGMALAAMLTVGPASASAGSAAAEPSPRGCPKGNFCMYKGTNQAGKVKAVEGNWRGSFQGKSYFNNGKPLPGLDHVQVTYKDFFGKTRSKCVHYNPGPGSYKGNLTGFLGTSVTFTKVTWRGEC